MTSSLEPQHTTRVVALMGSYRRHGTIDLTVEAALEGARGRGAATTKIVLKDHDLRFCENCRDCTQVPGPERGQCQLDDDLDEILTKLESADGVILAAPVNFGDVNAQTRSLLERMIGYAYWPKSAPAPKLRSRRRTGCSLLITSSAAPAVLTRTLSQATKTLKRMGKLLRKRPVGTVVLGRQAPGDGPSEAQLDHARTKGAQLADESAQYRQASLERTGRSSA